MSGAGKPQSRKSSGHKRDASVNASQFQANTDPNAQRAPAFRSSSSHSFDTGTEEHQYYGGQSTGTPTQPGSIITTDYPIRPDSTFLSHVNDSLQARSESQAPEPHANQHPAINSRQLPPLSTLSTAPPSRANSDPERYKLPVSRRPSPTVFYTEFAENRYEEATPYYYYAPVHEWQRLPYAMDQLASTKASAPLDYQQQYSPSQSYSDSPQWLYYDNYSRYNVSYQPVTSGIISYDNSPVTHQTPYVYYDLNNNRPSVYAGTPTEEPADIWQPDYSTPTATQQLYSGSTEGHSSSHGHATSSAYAPYQQNDMPPSQHTTTYIQGSSASQVPVDPGLNQQYTMSGALPVDQVQDPIPNSSYGGLPPAPLVQQQSSGTSSSSRRSTGPAVTPNQPATQPSSHPQRQSTTGTGSRSSSRSRRGSSTATTQGPAQAPQRRPSTSRRSSATRPQNTSSSASTQAPAPQGSMLPPPVPKVPQDPKRYPVRTRSLLLRNQKIYEEEYLKRHGHRPPAVAVTGTKGNAIVKDAKCEFRDLQQGGRSLQQMMDDGEPPKLIWLLNEDLSRVEGLENKAEFEKKKVRKCAKCEEDALRENRTLEPMITDYNSARQHRQECVGYPPWDWPCSPPRDHQEGVYTIEIDMETILKFRPRAMTEKIRKEEERLRAQPKWRGPESTVGGKK